MAGKGVVESELVPHLRETGVDIEVHALRGGSEQFGVIQIAIDVDQEHRVARPA